eukprot:GHVS01052127.1.p1 GENE.GHVS01052127.1~~GHVS01052127.1.p1  ORF type:complete len:138 (+),score=6.01 GHVS01052127.1:549-962(+)
MLHQGSCPWCSIVFAFFVFVLHPRFAWRLGRAAPAAACSKLWRFRTTAVAIAKIASIHFPKCRTPPLISTSAPPRHPPLIAALLPSPSIRRQEGFVRETFTLEYTVRELGVATPTWIKHGTVSMPLALHQCPPPGGL